MVAALSVAVLCWGVWIMFKPRTAAQPAESLQNVLIEHIEYLPEVYRAHENYADSIRNDTAAILVYVKANN